MSLTVRNTKDYLNVENFRFFGLIYGLSGAGKTSWWGTAADDPFSPADIGAAACETGLGNGTLSIAERGIDHIVVEDLNDLEAFCKGKVFPNKKILIVDSLTALAKGPIKEAALKIPRGRGESEKRKAGVPEIDDYGTIAELTRKLMLMLFNCNQDKHIIVTATEKYDRPNENDPPGTESIIGPELAGQMFLAAPALFDFVLRLRTRPKLRDPNDAKTRYSERYLITQQESGVLAKCRANHLKKPLLDKEEIWDMETGSGSFPSLLKKIIDGYKLQTSNSSAPLGGVTK